MIPSALLGCYEQNRAREQAADQQHPKTKYAPAWAGSSLLCLRLKQGAIMAANPIHRITVEEFRRLPESTGDYEYELHYGELVPLSRPKLKHHILQAKLRNLLRPLAPSGGWLDSEVAFRALPEYDFRVADVAFVSPERWKTADPEDNIHGSPDLVIEILSPSNTAHEMYDKEQLCLATGCREFWVVDQDARYVRVARTNGPSAVYRTGQHVPLQVLGSDASLSVDDLFA